MSHELRTPLNSIVGFSQLVELDGLDPRQSEHVGYVLKAAGHLLELINELLELERIEAGQMTISPEPVALADTVREALALVAPLARDRDVTLRSNTDGLAHDGLVHADRQRLKQVLLNLLSNAIKYNHAGGRVDISFQVTNDGRVRTTIADTGIGIEPDQLAKVFEPFERLGAERTPDRRHGPRARALKRADRDDGRNYSADPRCLPGVGRCEFLCCCERSRSLWGVEGACVAVVGLVPGGQWVELPEV